jgi:hypothetical protein
MKIITEKITIEELKEFGEGFFENMIKAVADIDLEIMAIGAEMHSDEEMALLDNGSKQEYLWGFNILFDMPREDWLEFDSMINIRPKQNRSRYVENQEIREKVINIVNNLIQ